jgi:hypothetical protein
MHFFVCESSTYPFLHLQPVLHMAGLYCGGLCMFWNKATIFIEFSYLCTTIQAISHTMVEIRNQCFSNLLLPCILHYFSWMSYYSTLKMGAESPNYQIPWHLILEDSTFEVTAHFHQFSRLPVHCYSFCIFVNRWTMEVGCRFTNVKLSLCLHH